MVSLKGIFQRGKNVNTTIYLDKNSQKHIYPMAMIDILKPKVIFDLGLLHGNKILPFITDQTNDIDELDDFKKK